MKKEKIMEALRLMFESVNSENEEESRKLLGDSIELIQSDERMKNPEKFDLFIGYKMKSALETLAEAVRDPSLVQRTSGMATFVYTNYGFMERNIASLCEMKEGRGCSVDKARFILGRYLKFALTGEEPSFTPGKGKYWIPKFGNEEDWMNFCESLQSLYYGNQKKFFESYAKLMSSDVKLFPYTLHAWHVEMKDGTDILVGHSWDESEREPMIEKAEFYLLHSSKAKGLNLETYQSTEEDPFPLTGFMKLPKNEIKRICKKSEQVER